MKDVQVTFLKETFVLTATYAEGDTATLPEDVAKRHVGRGNVRIGGDAPAEPEPEPKPTGTLGPNFPGAESLAEAGISTEDQLLDIITEKGDGWHTGIKGVGPATAADIVAALDL